MLVARASLSCPDEDGSRTTRSCEGQAGWLCPHHVAELGKPVIPKLAVCTALCSSRRRYRSACMSVCICVYTCARARMHAYMHVVCMVPWARDWAHTHKVLGSSFSVSLRGQMFRLGGRILSNRRVVTPLITLGPVSFKIGPTTVEAEKVRSNSGRGRARIDRIWVSFNRSRPNFVRNRPGRSCPVVGQTWAHVCQIRSYFGRHRPRLAWGRPEFG